MNFGRSEFEAYTLSGLAKSGSKLGRVVDAPLVEVIGLN
jgi:hypothetical protein